MTNDTTVRMTAVERARVTMDSLLDPHILMEAVRDGAGEVVDFAYVDANVAACEYNAMSREKLLSVRLLDLFPKHISSGLLDMYSAVLRDGEPLVLDDFKYENEIRGDRWYDVRAVRVGDDLLSYTWRDVTERHFSEARIRESEERFRLLSDNVNDVVLALDPLGVILWSSSGTSRVLGLEEKELVGMPAASLIYFADRAGLCQKESESPLSKAKSRRVRALRADGSLVWMIARLSPSQFADDGSISSMVLSMREIESEVQVEQALARSRRSQERDLVVADQLRIARDLHDTVIQGIFACGLSLTAVAQRVYAGSERESILCIADKLDDVIAELRTSVFDYSRTGSEPPLTVRVQKLVDEMSEASQVSGVADFSGSVDALVSDELAKEVAAVAHELLSNVVKHSEASNCQVSLEVSEGEDLVLTVQDDGGGGQSASEALAGPGPVGTGLTGYGLANARVRAESRGGVFRAVFMPGGGVEAVWRVPLEHVAGR